MQVRFGRGGVRNGVVTVRPEGEPRDTPEYVPFAVDDEVRQAIADLPPGSVVEVEYDTREVVLPPGRRQRRRVITGIAPVSP